MLMAFVSHEVAEISPKMAEWKAIANKVNELSKNFSSSNKSQSSLCSTDLPLHFFSGFLGWFGLWFFSHDRKINKCVWSMKQCLNLKENGEEEIQHWLLLLSNSFHSRCAGDCGICQDTLQGRKQCCIAMLLRNPSWRVSPSLGLATFSDQYLGG